MGITFAETFAELLYRTLSRCLSGAATTRTFQRDQVVEWIRNRLQRRAP